MNRAASEFWIRRSDIKRLFGASSLCYLSGAGEDVLQVAADLERLGRRDGPRPVPVVDVGVVPHLLETEICCVYQVRPQGGRSDEALRRLGLTTLPNPPAARSWIACFGANLVEELCGAQYAALSALEDLDRWVHGTSRPGAPHTSLFLVGQKVAPAAHSDRLGALFARAWIIEVSGGLSLKAISGHARLSSVRPDEPDVEPLDMAVDAKNSAMAAALFCLLTASSLEAAHAKYRDLSAKWVATLEELTDLRADHARLLNSIEKLDKPVAAVRVKQNDYHQLVRKVLAVAERVLPEGAKVAVVSRGDDDLLRMEGRDACHFPQTSEGVYTGHHPANSEASLAHLEEVRCKGAEFLLLPNTAFWWLEHYTEFRRHLEDNYSVVFQDDSCIVYALRSEASLASLRTQQAHLEAQAVQLRRDVQRWEDRERLWDALRSTLPANSTALVVSEGDNALLRIEGLTVWHFPQDESGRHAEFRGEADDLVAQLRALVAKGAEYLVIPARSLAWFAEQYELKRLLGSAFAPDGRHDDLCRIIPLRKLVPKMSDRKRVKDLSSRKAGVARNGIVTSPTNEV